MHVEFAESGPGHFQQQNAVWIHAHLEVGVSHYVVIYILYMCVRVCMWVCD